MRVKTRTSWRNHTGNQSIDPLRIYWPESSDDLVEIVLEGERLGYPVRAVGSGHSWSDVALTPGFLVETSSLPALSNPWFGSAAGCGFARSTPASTLPASRCRTWAATTARPWPA